MPQPNSHVVMFSGGIGSWAAAKRVAEARGTDSLALLFTDTLIEDADLYRFLVEAAAEVGGRLVRIAEGRTPWQLFRDEKMIGNSRADLCSRILKREIGDRWLAENCDPTTTTVYLGLDWSEGHRFDNGDGRGAKYRYASLGWQAKAPMCDRPHLGKREMIAWARRCGLTPSRAYAQGFAHDNCGGFCIKAGLGHYATLLRERPDVYRQHEAEEANPIFGGHTVLRERSGGETTPLSLKQYREQLQAGRQPDLFDIGGCGCYVE